MPTVHKSINYSERALSYIYTRLDPIVDDDGYELKIPSGNILDKYHNDTFRLNGQRTKPNCTGETKMCKYFFR